MEVKFLKDEANVSLRSRKSLNENEIIDEKTLELLQEASENDRLLPSPINIDVSKSTFINLPKLKWIGYSTVPNKMKLTNSGKTAILSAKWNDFPYITGGPLRSAEYVFSDLHFHWGKTALEGSEHLAEGGQYALEMHVMHTKKDYRTHNEATKRDDGIVMVVYLFEVRFHHNPYLQKVLIHLENVRQASSDHHIKPFVINKLVAPFEDDYYAYWGSITSKGELCPVLWIVCRHLQTISVPQLHLFHELLDPSLRTISRNWRPVKTDDDDRHLFYINPSAPVPSQTMDPKPLMFLENMHYPSQASIQEENAGVVRNKVSGS